MQRNKKQERDRKKLGVWNIADATEILCRVDPDEANTTDLLNIQFN